MCNLNRTISNILIAGFLASALLATPAHCTAFDCKNVDISLSTGVTHSAHFISNTKGLTISPLAPGRSWGNEWVLSNPISLDDPFRLPRKVHTALTVGVTHSPNTTVNIYKRFSVNGSNWSTWHALTRKNQSGNIERYEIDLEVPAYENEPYQRFIHEWFVQKNAKKDQKSPMTLTQLITSKDARWFEKHIPVVRYVQFLIDVPFPTNDVAVHSLRADMSWGTNQQREDLWFPGDPTEPRKSIEREQSTIQRSIDLTPVKGTTQSKTGLPVLRIMEDTRTPKERLCKFEIFNSSTIPISVVQAGIGRTKGGGMAAELQFPPTNWDQTGAPVGADMSPPGWDESLLSVGPPSAPVVHYSMSWQPKSKNDEIQPGKALQFALPLNLQEKTPCDQLHWTATLVERQQ